MTQSLIKFLKIIDEQPLIENKEEEILKLPKENDDLFNRIKVDYSSDTGDVGMGFDGYVNVFIIVFIVFIFIYIASSIVVLIKAKKYKISFWKAFIPVLNTIFAFKIFFSHKCVDS